MRQPRPGDVFARMMFERDPQECHANSVCVCCGETALSFENELSEREYEISVMCQECQNDTFVEDES